MKGSYGIKKLYGGAGRGYGGAGRICLRVVQPVIQKPAMYLKKFCIAVCTTRNVFKKVLYCGLYNPQCKRCRKYNCGLYNP